MYEFTLLRNLLLSISDFHRLDSPITESSRLLFENRNRGGEERGGGEEERDNRSNDVYTPKGLFRGCATPICTNEIYIHVYTKRVTSH